MLGDNASYRYIGGVLERNAELTKELKRLENTENVNIAQLTRLDRQLDEAKKQAREKEDELERMRKYIQTANDTARAAEAKVQDKEESLGKVEDKLKTLIETSKKHETDSMTHQAEARQMEEQLRVSRKNESDLRDEKRVLAEQLREKTEMLDEINNWRLPMKKIDKMERDTMSVCSPLSSAKLTAAANSVAKLQGLLTEAYSLVKDYFGDDVPDQIGKDAKAWEALRGHVAVSHPYKIPLPSSNSPQAKQMRVAAVLAVLGHHLAEEILQPLYILEEGGELNELLSELTSDDPPRGLSPLDTARCPHPRGPAGKQTEATEGRLSGGYLSRAAAGTRRKAGWVPTGAQRSLCSVLRDLVRDTVSGGQG
ncbi:hypothetical protein UCRPA7_8011 [Phaeoacremonium minimum UCRPA7]|uniref:Uncharacterized protein n=1 Tax=Phaeoacremonium minimum (strain UCR-PA7) TaxID=1286976 RepID=R8BB34_PHAM7|nr:hypothetical protein UCRPA7_8011 [Phaeoacremonium minimum UCRPA7]EON96492.1 hypothetical protein UCRPA7_8011 [Phaeoacremonium minimum UCRPA7]